MATIDEIKKLFQNILFREVNDADAAAFAAVVDSGTLTLGGVRNSLAASAESDLFVSPVIRLYQAAFGREPDKAGLQANVDALRNGATIAEIATSFTTSEEYLNRFNTNTVTETLIESLYQTVLGRASDAPGLASFLASGLTAGEILFSFSQSPEFISNSEAAVAIFLQEAGDGTQDFLGPLGGESTDTQNGDDGDDTLTGTPGNDILNGGAGNDVLIGLAGNDILDGGAGNDSLSGTSGVNIFIGGAGNDTLQGGLIVDAVNDSNLADYSSSTAGITVNLSGGVGAFGSTVTGDASVGTDILDSIDGFIGTQFNDTFTVDGSFKSQIFVGSPDPFVSIRGGGGDDTITGNGSVRVEYISANAGVTVNLATGIGSLTTGIGGAGDNVGTDTFTGVRQITGSSFDDILTGSAADFESFRGLAGNDLIDGGGGDNDRVDYVNSISGVIVDLSAGAIGSGTAQDGFGTVDTLIGIEVIRGSNFFDDVLIGDAGDNDFRSRGGDDTITGGAGIDEIRYAQYDDNQVIDLSAGTASGARIGNDTFTGIENARSGTGNDQLTGDAGDNVLRAGAGNDILNGGGGNDLLRGDSGNDILNGGAGNDTLTGGFGNNILTGGAGNDTLIGASIFQDDTVDFNRVDYRSATAGIVVDLRDGLDSTTSTVVGDASVGTDILVNVEFIFGTDFNDTFSVDSSFNQRSSGFMEIEGGSGDDTINGNSNGTRTSYGSALDGVTVDLGAGTARSTNAGDTANIGIDTLIGVSSIRGSNFADILKGSDIAGPERFRGQAGDDIIDGGGGDNDLADYRNSINGVVVDLSNGTAQDGFGSVDTLLNLEDVRGSEFSDTITGDSGDNTLRGRAGDDFLFGLGGNDDLLGENDNDVLVGGSGDDSLRGGAGDDRFSFDVGFGNDVITDFVAGVASGDVIEINKALGFNNLTEVLAATQTVNSDAVITLDGNTITLIGVNKSNLVVDDFDFV